MFVWWDRLKDVATLVTATIGVLSLLRKPTQKLFVSVKSYRDRRTLRSRLGAELYDIADIERAAEYYVEPDFQSVDPCGGEDFRRVVSAREPLFQSIDRLLLDPGQYRFLILLADSGMGKTSFVLNYYRRHWQSRDRRKAFSLYLVPLNYRDADDVINRIPKDRRREAVLFLDALDEDLRAIQDHKGRIQEILKQTGEFRTVLISCRTQFFANDEEIPGPTGIVKIAQHQPGIAGDFFFHKLYLAPFTDGQIDLYLKRKYSWRNRTKRADARNLVVKIPDLAARPMVLANIDRIVDSGKSFHSLYQIYEELVSAWIQEEKYVLNKRELWDFSEQLAEEIFAHRTTRGMERIPHAELESLAQSFGIKLADWQLRGRSLLNRDAAGNYKFAHRSIMEFLFVRRFLTGKVTPHPEPWTDLMKRFLLENMQGLGYVERRGESTNFRGGFRGCDLSGMDLHDFDLTDTDFRGANLSHTNLNGTTILRGNLAGANLKGASLQKANLRGADLREATADETDLAGADFRDTNLSGAILANVDLSQVKLAGADFRDTNLSGAILAGVDLSSVKLAGADFRDTNLNGAILAGVDLSNVKLAGADLRDTNLNGAILAGVDLSNAKLMGANLQKANLSGATLSRLDLRKVELAGADLQKANLSGATLSSLDLREVKLSGARLQGADLSDADLSGVVLGGTEY